MDNDRQPSKSEPLVIEAPYAGSIAERLDRLEFLEMLADGGNLAVNGIPWRLAYVKMRAIIERVPERLMKGTYKFFLEESNGRPR
jgi:hypothetical protein